MNLSLPQVGLASTVFTLGMGLAAIPGICWASVMRKSVVILGLFVFPGHAADRVRARACRIFWPTASSPALAKPCGGDGDYRHRRQLLLQASRALVTGSVSFAYGVRGLPRPRDSRRASLNAFNSEKPFVVFRPARRYRHGNRLDRDRNPGSAKARKSETSVNGAPAPPARVGGERKAIWNPTSITLGVASDLRRRGGLWLLRPLQDVPAQSNSVSRRRGPPT